MPKLITASASDIDCTCQKVLCGLQKDIESDSALLHACLRCPLSANTSQDVRPLHVFGDLLERVTPEMQQRLDKIRASTTMELQTLLQGQTAL